MREQQCRLQPIRGGGMGGHFSWEPVIVLAALHLSSLRFDPALYTMHISCERYLPSSTDLPILLPSLWYNSAHERPCDWLYQLARLACGIERPELITDVERFMCFFL